MNKKILKIALVSGLSLLLSVAPVLAVADSGNSNTGANSTNNTSVTTTRVFTITNSNSSTVTNAVSSWVNSGYNSASYNTGNGTIGTGEAKWGSSFATKANCNETGLTLEGSGDPSATNETTGAESDNDATVNVANVITLVNENGSAITNGMTVDVDSGFNAADYNTGHGSVTAGDAEGDAFVDTETNANQATIEGSVVGEHSAANEDTGYNSDNDAGVTVANVSILTNENSALLGNLFDIWVASGWNSASYNTGNGTVTSGKADGGSDIEILNKANGSFATIEGGVGDTEGASSNTTTGALSDNDAFVTATNTVLLANENWGSIQNMVGIMAVSGWNFADYNTGNGLVGTDDSKADVDVENSLNSNFAAVGSSSPLQSSGTASNEWTGDESDNDALVTTTNNLTVVNDNNDPSSGGVTNAVGADAYSGYNSASYNTGNGGIGTGESSVGVGLATDENSNLTLFAGFGANTDSMWNDHTGYSSNNWATVVHTDLVTSVTDNWGWIANLFDDEVNSGTNTADYNTGNSSIVTDDAELTEETDDSMNSNYFGPPGP